MTTITKAEWRRRCIAYLRKHGSEDLRDYNAARSTTASIEADQRDLNGESGIAWASPEDTAQEYIDSGDDE